MFRYLEKFTGKYRVLADYDLYTNDFPRNDNGGIEESFEDLYIPCKRGIIKHTYEDDSLVLCFYNKSSTGNNVYKEIKDKYKDIYLKLEEIGIDLLIYFNVKDIDKIATIVKPRTSGSKIKWSSTKNLPKKSYEIPDEMLNELKNITEGLSQTDKMQFGRRLNSEFLDYKNLKEQQKLSGLNPKEYIYSNNLWEEYIEYGKELLGGK